MARDPVCGMEVEPRAAEHATVYEGKPFFFCAAGCEKVFTDHASGTLQDRG